MALPTLKTTKKAMKAGKATTVMKAKRVVRKRKSIIAKRSDYKKKGWAYRAIWRGTKTKSSGGLKKADLICNKRGRIVSGKAHARAAKSYVQNNLDLWIASFMQSRRACAIKGFVCPRKDGGLELQRQLYKKTLEGFVAKNVERLNKKLSASLSSSMAMTQPTADDVKEEPKSPRFLT